MATFSGSIEWPLCTGLTVNKTFKKGGGGHHGRNHMVVGFTTT
jgi:hypothetical protein